MRGKFLLLPGLLCLSRASAQDLFEIHIYEYESLAWREYSLEAHLNITSQGTSQSNGTLLPTAQQTHLTLEPTFGFSESFAVGFMFLNAWPARALPEDAPEDTPAGDVRNIAATSPLRRPVPRSTAP